MSRSSSFFASPEGSADVGACDEGSRRLREPAMSAEIVADAADGATVEVDGGASSAALTAVSLLSPC